MSERLKVLDCNRKAILGLPPNALKLWLTYFMSESEWQEAWPSQSTLMAITGMSKNTLIHWQRYLKAGGWLRETGAKASDRYACVTPGSHNIPVVRVDDPTKGSKIEPLEIHTITDESQGVQFLNPPKFEPKVSGSGSGSGSGSRSTSPSHSDSESTAAPRSCKEEVKNEDQNQKPENPKTNTGTKTKTRLAGDGTPWPEDFDSWSNLRRTTWLQEHDGSDESRKAKDTWDRQLAIARRSEFLAPVTTVTAAAGPPPAPIKQEQKQGMGEFRTRDGRMIQEFPDDE